MFAYQKQKVCSCGGGGRGGGGGGFFLVYVIGLNDPRPRLDGNRRVRQCETGERKRGREGENKAVKQLDTHTYSAFTLGFNKLNAFQTLQPARFQPVSPPRSARFSPLFFFQRPGGLTRWNQNYSQIFMKHFSPKKRMMLPPPTCAWKKSAPQLAFFASFNQVRSRLFHGSLTTVALFFFKNKQTNKQNIGFWSELRYDRPSSELPGPHTDHVCPPYCAMKMEGEEREQSGWVAHIRDVFSRLKTWETVESAQENIDQPRF